MQYFISELRTVRKCNARARDLLSPIIQQRQTRERNGDLKKPNDAIEWLRDLVPEPDKNDPHFHGISQLGIGAVSVNTTSQLITNSIFNLATYPEYAPILREEIDSVLKEFGGEWTLESMGHLKKLDSFVKETLRHSGHLTGKGLTQPAIIAHSLREILQQPLFSEKHSDRSHSQMGATYPPARLPSPPRTQSTSTQTYIQMPRHLTVCASTIFDRRHRRTRKSTNLRLSLKRRCNLEAADTLVREDGSLVTKSSWCLRPFSIDMRSN